ncbi:MAG: rod shape-determining protein MreC [Gemmatimonadaceae bacterium]
MARAVRSGSRVDAALLIACALFALLGIVLPTQTRAAIAGALQRSLASPLLGLQRRSERARTAFAERERVAARTDSLVLRVTELSQLEAENQRLRNLLALGRRLGRGFVPAEGVHGQGIGDSHTLLLTVGSRAGVTVRAAVVAPEGVVGLVTSVNPTTSQAIMWSHPDFRVSAMSADGSTFGIVTPHLSGDSECTGAEQTACAAAERMLLELRGVAFRDALKAGTQIASSGLGGVFPRGIAIGSVIGELKTTEQWSRSYLVRPAVRPQDVSNVMVLSPQLVNENLEGIWLTPGGADSVVRQVIAAGDSLARQAAAAATARQRVVDSLAAAQRAAADSTAALRPPPTAAPPAVLPPARRDSVRRLPRARPDTIQAPS